MDNEMLEFDLGCTPHAEDCFQVGQEDYWKLAAETGIYKKQLIRNYPIQDSMKTKFYLKIQKNYHEFGSYPSLVLVFDEKYLEKARSYEQGMENWDEMAKLELRALSTADDQSEWERYVDNKDGIDLMGLDANDLPDGTDLQELADALANDDWDTIMEMM